MGILTSKRDERYVILSDRSSDHLSRKQAPKQAAPLDQAWTGNDWSIDMTTALSFETMAAADDYVREHYNRLAAKR